MERVHSTAQTATGAKPKKKKKKKKKKLDKKIYLERAGRIGRSAD
jgi:hypothetical protein